MKTRRACTPRPAAVIRSLRENARNLGSWQDLTHGSEHRFSLPEILDRRGAGVGAEPTAACLSWLKTRRRLPGWDCQIWQRKVQNAQLNLNCRHPVKNVQCVFKHIVFVVYLKLRPNGAPASHPAAGPRRLQLTPKPRPPPLQGSAPSDFAPRFPAHCSPSGIPLGCLCFLAPRPWQALPPPLPSLSAMSRAHALIPTVQNPLLFKHPRVVLDERLRLQRTLMAFPAWHLLRFLGKAPSF